MCSFVVIAIFVIFKGVIGMNILKTFNISLLNDDIGEDVKVTQDGGRIIVGGYHWPSSSLTAAFILKLSSSGDVEWAREWDSGNGYDILTYVVEIDGGGYVAAGTGSFTDDDIIVARFDENGNQMWANHYDYWNDDSPCFLDVVDNEIIIFALGGINRYGIMRIFLNGTMYRTTSEDFGGNVYRFFDDVTKTNSGDYLMLGRRNFGTNGIFVAIFNARGDITLSRYWQSTTLYPNSVYPTSDGGIIGGGSNSSPRLWLIKFNSTYHFEWSKDYNCADTEYDSGNGQSIRTTNDGGYLIMGSATDNGGTGSDRTFIAKFDSEGNCQSGKVYLGGEGDDFPQRMNYEDTTGEISIVGTTNDGEDLMLASFESLDDFCGWEDFMFADPSDFAIGPPQDMGWTASDVSSAVATHEGDITFMDLEIEGKTICPSTGTGNLLAVNGFVFAFLLFCVLLM